MRIFDVLSTTYDKFDSTVQAFLNKVFGGLGQAYSSSNLFGAIFTGIKGVMQNIMFYIEDAMTEQNIFTATRKKSVYSLAKLSGYEPWYGSAATGTILLTDQVTNGLPTGTSKIIIQNGDTVVEENTGNIYVISLPTDSLTIDLAKPLVTHEVKIIQGKWQSSSYTADGDPLETIEITVDGLYDKDFIEVYVNGEKWDIGSCLYDLTQNEKRCIVNGGYEADFYVMFGDGMYGKALSEGDQVTIQYIAHNGSQGNITPSSSTSIKFNNNLKDSLGNSIDGNNYITCVVNNYISGGTDADSISMIRSITGTNSRSLVIASKDSFSLFLKRFSFIGQFSLITHKDSLDIDCIAFSNFKNNITTSSAYYDLAPSNMILKESQKEMVLSALSNSDKTFAGVSLNMLDPTIRKYAIVCYLKVPSSYTKEAIKIMIKKYIADYFMSLDNNDMQFIAKSDIIKTITTNLPTLTSFDFDFISEDDEQAASKGYWYKKTLVKTSIGYSYASIRQIYDPTDKIGLDDIGNIRLNSKFEMPIIHQINLISSNQSVKMDPVEFYFL